MGNRILGLDPAPFLSPFGLCDNALGELRRPGPIAKPYREPAPAK